MISVTAQNLLHLLATYGYWAVFVFIAIESMGIPFPGETMLLVAAIYAGTTHRLSILLVIVAAASGAILGDNLGFMIGRVGGYRLLRRYGHYIRVNERKLKLGQYLFMKHGGKVVFFGRFVAVLRAWAAFLAGTNRMRWPGFLFFNALGGIVWATLFGLGGYYLGDNIHRLTGPVAITCTVLATLIIIAFLIFVHRNEQRLEAEAERALQFGVPLLRDPMQASDKELKRLIIQMPLERFRIKNYFEYNEEDDTVQIAPQLWQDLRYYEIIDVLKSADEQITYYYKRGIK
ncbi:MAG: DedA family protein [Chloroflexi bacterium]|nr:MAG: DedA family protein [Chloroflexota bacterium]